jgi:chromosome partitioning protein
LPSAITASDVARSKLARLSHRGLVIGVTACNRRSSLTRIENALIVPARTPENCLALRGLPPWGTHMHAIVLATQKGGSGKSSLAIGLAVAAMEDGRSVGMIEADPQGTLANWGGRRTNPKPRIERAGSGAEIERAILHLQRDGIALAVIDTAATDNAVTSSGITAADLCLIPVRPSPADIEAALPTLDAARRLNKRFAFILNQTPARSYRVSEAAAALYAAGALALPFIVQRNDHQDALGAGLGVTEFNSGGKAADEIRGLWQWVRKTLTTESHEHGSSAIKAAG